MDTGNAIAALRQQMPAKLFSQPEAYIDHSDDHPALRHICILLFCLVLHSSNGPFMPSSS